MRYDTLLRRDLHEVADEAREYAEMGFDGVFTFEGNRDVFYPLVVAAEHTDLDVYTNVAIAFPRSPMHLAYQSYDLQRLSGGRFTLGVGSQIRTHIERRYSAHWDKPVAQMRELIASTKAIFACWSDDERLDFQGDYYNFTLMTPVFDPGPVTGGPPPIWAGALGPRMTQAMAEVADGLLIHPFNSERFLRERTMPAVEAGLAASGRTRADFSLGIDAMVGVYRNEAEREAAERGCRANLAFYGSTPAYRVTLDVHGWGELQTDLNARVRRGEWGTLGEAIDDEVLTTIAVMGTPAEVAAQLHSRYGDLATRIGFSTPYETTPELLGELLDALR